MFTTALGLLFLVKQFLETNLYAFTIIFSISNYHQKLNEMQYL